MGIRKLCQVVRGDYYNFIDALLLFAINLASFNLAAKTTLLVAGVRPVRSKDNHFLKGIILYIIGWIIALLLLGFGLYFRT
jgi:hypothetical protein